VSQSSALGQTTPPDIPGRFDLLRLLLEEPRAGVREYARVLGVARGTVQFRIARLERAGVVLGYAAQLSPAAVRYDVTAYVHLHLAQGRLDEVSARLVEIAEALQAHTTTGDGDLAFRGAAQDNAHLEQVVERLLASPGVVRT